MEAKLVCSCPGVAGNTVDFEAEGRVYRSFVCRGGGNEPTIYRIEQGIIRRFGREWRKVPYGAREDRLRAALVALVKAESLPLDDGTGEHYQ